MRKRRHVVGYLFALALTMAGLCSAAIAQTSTLKGNGKIAFSVFSHVGWDRSGISVMNPDGSSRAALTSTQIICPQPNRSPGTCGPDHLDFSPAWSPDGNQIAFIRSVPAPNLRYAQDVFVMNADGSNQRRLTLLEYVHYPSRPSWSPDGMKIAFVGPHVGDYYVQIYVMNVDGSGQRPIGRGVDPAWSPDGSKLVFTSLGGLHLMNPDGSGRIQITFPKNPSSNLVDYDWGPTWSPDGTRIIFNRSVGCDWDDSCESITIWTVNSDGSNPAKLADIATSALAWSPDGTKILFSSNGDLFTMQANGGNVTKITNIPDEAEWLPSWQAVAPPSVNLIDDPAHFIRQQYLDFLDREPEPAGLQFYLNILNGCHPADTECVKYTRGALSANFFRSPEFGRKGAYVANLFNIVIGQRPKTVAELNDPNKVERPHYAEFMADLATLSTPNDDPVLTDQKKDQLASAWLARTEVLAILPGSLSNQQFVQKLESIGGVTLANENMLIANLNNGSQTRAQVLRAIAESNEVVTKFYNPNFVTMEYLGFLRRDPEDCHVSSDPESCGFIFHNRRFNIPGANTDLIENIIVRGFIESPEYRRRFGP